MQQVQDLFQSFFFYSAPALAASPPNPRTPTRKAIPSNLSHLPSPQEEATFHSMMSDHRLRSGQKQRSSEFLRVEIMNTNPSDENMSFDDDFLTPQEVWVHSRRRNSFSPGEENKQPDSSSREKQLAAWKADRHRRMSGTAAKSSNPSFRNSTPRVNGSSNATHKAQETMSAKPPLVQTQQLGEKHIQPHSTNSKAMVRSHASFQQDQSKPRYSLATFSSSLSGLPPKNTSSVGQTSQMPRSNSKSDAQWHRGEKLSLDYIASHIHVNSTIASDQGCVNSMYQSPKSCSACDTTKYAGRRCSLPIRRSNSMVLFSEAENEPLTRMNSIPGQTKRRASIGTNPLERLSTKAAARRINERSLRNSSPSRMTVEIFSHDPSNDDILASASPLTCSVCSGSKCYYDEEEDHQIGDDVLKEFIGVGDDTFVDKDATNESHHSVNSMLLADPSNDSDDICSASHPTTHMSQLQQRSLRSSSDLTDHELEEILARRDESERKRVTSSSDLVIGAEANVELCVVPRDSGLNADQAINEKVVELPEPVDVFMEEKLQTSKLSNANGHPSDDATESGLASLCKEKSIASGQDVNKVGEGALSSIGEGNLDEVSDNERLLEQVAEDLSMMGDIENGYEDNEANACLVHPEGSFGSFEEGVVMAYRGMKDEDVSEETVLKTGYTIEEECPQLTSALLELEAFDWRNELVSPVIAELPERRRTDTAKLFLPATNLSNSEDFSPQIESPPLETPESQVSQVSFDWRQELQSPLLQPRLKRRIRTSILSCIQSEGHRSPDSTIPEDAICQEISLNETLQQVECIETTCVKISSTPTKATPRNDGILKNSTQKSPFHNRVPSPVPDELARKIPSKSLFLDNSGTAFGSDLRNKCPDELSAHSNAVKEDGGFDVLFEAAELIKINGKSVLFTIPEDAADIRQAVVAEVTRLLNQNRKFHDQIYEMRKSCDDRITPFRDLLDERRKIAAEKLLLTKERSEMESQLAEKQQKMNVTVQLSIEKVRFLQSKLNEAKQGKHVLAEKVAELQQENERLKREIESVQIHTKVTE